MLFLQICLFGMTARGVWFILTEFVRFPSRRAEKACMGGGAAKKKGSLLDRLLEPLAKRLEARLSNSGYKKEKLGRTLRVIGDNRTAARCQADAITEALVVVAVGLCTALVLPLLGAAFLPFAVYVYLDAMRKPEKLLTEKRERIELELPRFASTISNSLTVSRDVVKILSNYRRVCGPELRGELDVTLADMKTGNQQDALRGLENRIGSTKLSDLVRGLMSVLRGEDQTLYFFTKNIEFRKEYIELQKREIQKRPSKLMPNVIWIVGCFCMMLLYVLGMQVMNGKSFFM